MEKFDKLIGITVVAIGVVVGIAYFIVPDPMDSLRLASRPEMSHPAEFFPIGDHPPDNPVVSPVPEPWRLPESESDADSGMSPGLFPEVSTETLESFKPPTFPPDQKPRLDNDQASTSEKTDPGDIWFTAFTLFQKGEEEMKSGDSAAAREKLKLSKKLFDQLGEQFPEFNPEIVKFRRDNLTALIEE